ncbi:MAG: hypothetical protein V7605_1879 [Acidimicrobiaceae bacterium]
MSDTASSFDACVRITRSAVTGDIDALVAALGDFAPGELAAAMRRHQLRPLVQHALEAHGAGALVSDGVHQALADAAPAGPRPSGTALLEGFVAARDTLAAAGIGVLLLKGAVLGERLYGGVDVRPQYDVDVLVASSDARRARRVLESSGFRPCARDSHSVTLRRGAVSVDVHHGLRTSPAYRIDERGLWDRATTIGVAGHEILTLADTDTMTLLAMSVVEDLGFAMAKLKNLCDVWLLARVLDAGTDWDGWLSARRAENLEAVVATGCALALEVMSTPGDPPRLGDALARRRHLTGVANHTAAIDLLTSPRGAPANLAWFAGVYPGSLLRYRMHAFVGGLPDTLRYVRPGRLRYLVELRRVRRARPGLAPSP